MRDRIPDGRWSAPIGRALSLIPPRTLEVIGPVRFVCGVAPSFAGLHKFGSSGDGRSYDITPHACYPWHLTRPAADRVPTVVLPKPVQPATVVHELGHILDFRLGFHHTAKPVNWYAATDRQEAFAEAFVASLYIYADQDIARGDTATVQLFKDVAA